MRGRKPKPIEQRQREGNPGKRAMPAPVVVQGRVLSAEGLPPPPAHLTDAGAEKFTAYAAMLSEVGIFDLADGPALAALCEAECEAESAYAVLQAEGHTIRGSRADLVIHPAYKIYRDSRRDWLRYAEQFALTPVARARLGLAGLMGKKLSRELDLPAHPRDQREPAKGD